MSWLAPAILFPDVELLVTGRLRTLLSARSESYVFGTVVSNKVPNPRPPRLVVIRRDGGTPLRERDRARLGVQVWGGTEQQTNDLARLVRALLMKLPGSDGVLYVDPPTAPIDTPDESGHERRYFTTEIHVRGTQI